MSDALHIFTTVFAARYLRNDDDNEALAHTS